MSKLEKHFERLLEFARAHDFRQPFSRVSFVEATTPPVAFEVFESRFDELLEAGHSWINLIFEGVDGDDLFVVVEVPNHPNAVPPGSVAVNLALGRWKID